MAGWDTYKQIRELYDRNDWDGALALIASTRPDVADIRSYVSCLEANCYAHTGNAVRGAQLLQQEVDSGSDNFWVYYAIAELYRNLGKPAETLAAYHAAHALHGWPESQAKQYIFTHDFFSPNIPSWSGWFEQHIVCQPIRCLEIGSWQGTSAAWLLDKVVSKRGGLLTCIDTFEGSSEHLPWLGSLPHSIEYYFDRNVTASGHADFCRKLVGKSQDILLLLSDQSYDFIYIDGAHEAKFVIQDAVLSWRILRSGGFLIFDDLDHHFAATPEQDTEKAITAFTTWFADELEIVDTNRQMLIRKR